MRSKIAGLFVLACVSLPGATTRVELDDAIYQIRAGDTESVEVDLRQEPATVMATYLVHAGSTQVRILLLSKDDLEHLPEDAILARTARGNAGAFAYRVRDRDKYVIVVDNRADKANAATVRLRISLDFARPRVTQLPPGRKLTVIAVSFLAFLAVVTYSARKLLKAART
jgi:hypothetical protein